jgi:flagellar FliL protein
MRRLLISWLLAMLCVGPVIAAEDHVRLAAAQHVTYYYFPDQFTTNLRHSNRLVQATIALDTSYEDAVIYRVIKHRLPIADEIIVLLSNITEAGLRDPESKHQLEDAIRDAVNAVLQSKYQFGGIDHAYIISMVIR